MVLGHNPGVARVSKLVPCARGDSMRRFVASIGDPTAGDGASAMEYTLIMSRGVQNRGFCFEVSNLRGDLDADERVEMGNTCLGGE